MDTLSVVPNSLFTVSKGVRQMEVGAVASTSIQAGTVICVDHPLIVLQGHEIGLRDVMEHHKSRATNKIYHTRGQPVIQKKYEELSEADQCLAASLFDCFDDSREGDPDRRKLLLVLVQKALDLPEDDVEKMYTTETNSGALPKGKKSIFGIFRTNCIPEGDENAQGLYALISRFNHSCQPNAIYQWRPALGTNVVVATRDIGAGEDICVSYFKSLYMTKAERHRRTFLSWGFHCQCQACQPIPDHLKEEMEATRERLRHMARANPSMTDADVERMIPAEHFKWMQHSADSDQRREQLWQLNQQMEAAASFRHGLKMHTEMRRLFGEEKLLPGLRVESLLNYDLLNLHAIYGTDLAEARRVTQEQCRLEELLYGSEGNKELAKFMRWRDSERGAPTAVDFEMAAGMPLLGADNCQQQ